MGWTRKTRHAARPHRLELECLETRQLLSNVSGLGDNVPLTSTPLPAAGNTTGSAADYAITGAAQTRSQYGVDGAGMTVALIDTGIDYNNPAFGGGGFGPGHKVVAGYDFGDNSSNPIATTTQHGTYTAGIVASSDSSNPGIAPGADLVELKVFDNNGQSDFNHVAAALQWVVNNHSQYNITAVNMSLSDGNNYTQNWFGQDGSVGQQVTDLIHELDLLNIPVVSATGNSFNGQQGEGFTAIVPDTISVTSTDGPAQVAANAQRLGTALGGASATKVAAPGVNVPAPTGDSGFTTVSGTSFAAPAVTGTVVLLQQIYEQRFGSLPTVNQLTNWLQQGADPLNDPVTGITLNRLDIPKAAALVPGAPAPAPAPPPVQTPSDPNAGTPTPPAPTPPPPPTPPPVQTPTNTNPAPPPTPPTPPPTSGDNGTPSSPGGSDSSSSRNGASTGTNEKSTSTSTTPTNPPPPSNPTPPPQTPAAGSDGSTTQLFIQGQSLNSLNSSQLNSSWGAGFSAILKSFLSWGAGSGGSAGQVGIWTANVASSNSGQN